MSECWPSVNNASAAMFRLDVSVLLGVRRRNLPSAVHRTQCQGTAGAVKQTRERPQYGTQSADSHPWRELPDLMNLQHLRYLVGFSEHRTHTDAADSLGISQPAISRALHELEPETGCILFQPKVRRLDFEAGKNVV